MQKHKYKYKLKRVVAAIVTTTAATSVSWAASSPWQQGPISRQLCFNLESIIAGELNSTSTLARLKRNEMNAGSPAMYRITLPEPVEGNVGFDKFSLHCKSYRLQDYLNAEQAINLVINAQLGRAQ